MAYTAAQQEFLNSVDDFIAKRMLYTASDWNFLFSRPNDRYIFSVNYPPPLPASLLYWWKFNEDGGGGALPWIIPPADPLYPVEYNGNSGNTLMAGGAAFPVFIASGGHFDNYLQYIQGGLAAFAEFPSLANPLGFLGKTAITIDFWVNSTLTPGGLFTNMTIGAPGGVPPYLVIDFNDVALTTTVTGYDLGAAPHAIVGPFFPGPPTWHHIRIVLDETAGGAITLWVDGGAPTTANFGAINWQLFAAGPPITIVLSTSNGEISLDNLAIFDGAFPLPGDGTVPTVEDQWPAIP